MGHNLGGMAGALAHGVVAHLSVWEGWAVLLAAALLVWQSAAWWAPIVAALVINPEPFGLVSGLVHSRHVSLTAALMFTLCQVVLAFAGFGAARFIQRFR
jgi:hypothetical protein